MRLLFGRLGRTVSDRGTIFSPNTAYTSVSLITGVVTETNRKILVNEYAVLQKACILYIKCISTPGPRGVPLPWLCYVLRPLNPVGSIIRKLFRTVLNTTKTNLSVDGDKSVTIYYTYVLRNICPRPGDIIRDHVVESNFFPLFTPSPSELSLLTFFVTPGRQIPALLYDPLYTIIIILCYYYNNRPATLASTDLKPYR